MKRCEQQRPIARRLRDDERRHRRKGQQRGEHEAPAPSIGEHADRQASQRPEQHWDGDEQRGLRGRQRIEAREC